jgi:hypothetical protein
MMSVAAHDRVSGRAGRAKVLDGLCGGSNVRKASGAGRT